MTLPVRWTGSGVPAMAGGQSRSSPEVAGAQGPRPSVPVVSRAIHSPEKVRPSSLPDWDSLLPLLHCRHVLYLKYSDNGETTPFW